MESSYRAQRTQIGIRLGRTLGIHDRDMTHQNGKGGWSNTQRPPTSGQGMACTMTTAKKRVGAVPIIYRLWAASSPFVPLTLQLTAPRRTPSAAAATRAPSTVRRRSALRAVTPPPRSARTSGARRPSAERPPVPAACATSRTSAAAPRTASRPARLARRSLPKRGMLSF